MFKYVVVAVFSICALPCFAVAQDCGCGASPTMAAPVMDMGMDMGMSSDCGCNAAPAMDMGMSSDCGCNAAPEPSCCAPRSRKKLSLTKQSKEVCRLKLVCSTDCCGCPTRKLVRQKKTVCRPKLSLVDAPARQRCGCAGGRLKGMLSKIGSCGGGGGCGSAPAADCGCGAAPAPVADCGCGS